MDAPYAPAEYKNRSTGLTLFGLAEILLGGLCLLVAPLTLFGQVMAAKATGEPPNFKMAIPSALMYVGLAVMFVWLGIGSMKGRRWARAISLVLGWSWLLVGLVTLVMTTWILPSVLRASNEAGQVPPAALAVAMLFALGFTAVFFVLIPGAIVLFYRSPHVKATCEAMDPTPRWTDACPLPVLAVALWCWFASAMMLSMPLAYNGALPLFGFIITGLPGMLIFAVLAAALGYAGWSMYRLQLTGWWLVFIILAGLTISNMVTFAKVDLATMYREMGFPEQQIAHIERINVFGPTQIVMWTAMFMIPVLGYLLFIKKYFRSAPPAPALSPA